MGLDVHQLGVSGGMAEGLHHQIGGEAQASQILQLVAGHGAGGVLRADRGHLGLAIGAGTHALAFRQATGAADHLLGQRETLAGIGGHGGQTEQGGRRQTQSLAGLGGQATADDQGDTATGAHFVENHLGLDGEFADDLAVLQGLALIGTQLDHVAHIHLVDVQLDGQGAGIFHGVVEDGSDLGAQADAAEPLVRHEGNVLAGEPQHGIGRRLARRTGADHVTHIGDQIALLGQAFQLLQRAALASLVGLDAGTGILQHGKRMQGDVGTAPGVGSGRQIVGIGLAGHLEDGDGEGLRHFRTRGEPLGIGPGLQHALGIGIALIGQGLDVMEEVEHQQGLLQALGGDTAHLGVAQQLDQRLDVEAAQHGAQQLGRLFARNQRTGLGALGDLVQIFGLDLGGVVHTGGNPVGDQLDESLFLALGRVPQKSDQGFGLLGGQRQGRNPERGAFGDMLAIGFKHGEILSIKVGALPQ